MGGPNKLLLPYGATTVVGAVVKVLLACRLDVVVVTGRDASLVTEAASPARAVFNSDFEQGLGGSIACGVRSLPEGCDILVALGDMPGIRREVVASLIAQARDDRIVVPVYADQPGTPGHPVLFGSSFRGELERLSGDTGARRVVESNPRAVLELAVSGSLRDLDTPQSSSERPVG